MFRGSDYFRWQGLLLICLAWSCTQQTWSPSRTSSQSSSQELVLKGSDRPTETGAGVPGYLVNCSLLTERSEVEVHVGCGLVDLENQAVSSPPNAWQNYQFVPPATAPASLQVKKQASDTASLDVLFLLSGAERKVLMDLALTAQFSFTDRDAQGQAITVSNQPLRVEAGSPQVVITPPSEQECDSGTLQDGICFFLTPRSCENACSQSGLEVHAAVIETFGSAEESNADNCKAMYQKLKGTRNIRFSSRELRSGLGCHQTPFGLVLFDESKTRLDAFPALGGNRLCACQ